MMIKDYKVTNNSTLALIPRQHEVEDLNGLNGSSSTHETSVLTPLAEDSTTKMYHLVSCQKVGVVPQMPKGHVVGSRNNYYVQRVG